MKSRLFDARPKMKSEVLSLVVLVVSFGACAEWSEAELAAAPYVVMWNGRGLELNPARISSVPFCRVWPGHQRELSQTEMSYFVRFDASRDGKLVLRGHEVGKRFRRMLPLGTKDRLAIEA